MCRRVQDEYADQLAMNETTREDATALSTTRRVVVCQPRQWRSQRRASSQSPRKIVKKNPNRRRSSNGGKATQSRWRRRMIQARADKRRVRALPSQRDTAPTSKNSYPTRASASIRREFVAEIPQQGCDHSLKLTQSREGIRQRQLLRQPLPEMRPHFVHGSAGTLNQSLCSGTSSATHLQSTAHAFRWITGIQN